MERSIKLTPKNSHHTPRLVRLSYLIRQPYFCSLRQLTQGSASFQGAENKCFRVLSREWYVCSTPLPPKALEEFQKRGQKELNSQRQWVITKKLFYGCTRAIIQMNSAVLTACTRRAQGQARQNSSVEREGDINLHPWLRSGWWLIASGEGKLVTLWVWPLLSLAHFNGWPNTQEEKWRTRAQSWVVMRRGMGRDSERRGWTGSKYNTWNSQTLHKNIFK